MSITNNRLPWLIDINVFMTPISHINWNTSSVNTSAIKNGWRYSSNAQNDEINYDVILAKGTWTIEALHHKGATHGIASVQLDGVQVGTMDAYAGVDTYNQRSSVTGVAVTRAGKYRLKFKMSTKNASSTAYSMYLQHIQLRRTV